MQFLNQFCLVHVFASTELFERIVLVTEFHVTHAQEHEWIGNHKKKTLPRTPPVNGEEYLLYWDAG